MSNDLTELTVVIPQYGQSDLTIACLKSLDQHESKEWPVIVVDDGSDADELDWLMQHIPERVRVIAQDQQGVTAAWNRGMLEVSTEYVLFLNNDVVFHGAVLDSLLLPFRCASTDQEKQVRMVGMKGRQENHMPSNRGWNHQKIHFLEGWAMCCRVDDYFRLGGFDEQMELYFSDTDFQLRMLDEYGDDCLKVVGGLSLEHLGHRTAHQLEARNEKWRRDRNVFLQKWAERQWRNLIA